jgi:uncharacterized membrane protein
MRDVDGTAAVIGLMACATYFTRFAGFWLVSTVRATPLLRSFLHHVSGSALAALVVPAAVGGDGARLAGVASAALVMLLTRKPLFALAVGTVLAALFRIRIGGLP